MTISREKYSLAIQSVKDAQQIVRWCIESGASADDIQSARAELITADLQLDQILSRATLTEREDMLFFPREC